MTAIKVKRNIKYYGYDLKHRLKIGELPERNHWTWQVFKDGGYLGIQFDRKHDALKWVRNREGITGPGGARPGSGPKPKPGARKISRSFKCSVEMDAYIREKTSRIIETVLRETPEFKQWQRERDCPHGNRQEDCEACFRLGDFAFEVERERQVFGGQR